MFYLHLFLDTLFSVVGIYILSRLVLNNITGSKGIIVGLLSSLLFLFNPWSVDSTYITILADVSLGTGGFTLFLIGLFLYLNGDTPKKAKLMQIQARGMISRILHPSSHTERNKIYLGIASC